MVCVLICLIPRENIVLLGLLVYLLGLDVWIASLFVCLFVSLFCLFFLCNGWAKPAHACLNLACAWACFVL